MRHGETDWNKQRLMQGHTDIPLNETGKNQALAIKKKFETVQFDHIYSSDLIRAAQTAAYISGQDLDFVKKDARLRERCFGPFEGKKISDLDFESIFSHPEVETHDSVSERLKDFLTQKAELYTGKTVLVASHGGTMRTLLAMIFQRQEMDFFLENGAIVHFTLSPQESKILSLSGVLNKKVTS